MLDYRYKTFLTLIEEMRMLTARPGSIPSSSFLIAFIFMSIKILPKCCITVIHFTRLFA